MHLIKIVSFLALAGLTASLSTIEAPVLKRLQAAEGLERRRVDPEAEDCDIIVDVCTEFETVCMDVEIVCDSGTWDAECTDWDDVCVLMEDECVDGFEPICTETTQACTAGWDTMCAAYDTTCDYFLPWPMDSVCGMTTEVCVSTTEVCKGYESICTETTMVCKGFGEVCKETDRVCNTYEDVCRGTTYATCTAYGEICKSSYEVCDTVDEMISNVKEWIEDLTECLDNALSTDYGGLYDPSCNDYIGNPVHCTVSAHGDTVEAGFKAGCTIPKMTFGMEFGSLEDDKDNAVASITIGILSLEVPLLQQRWSESPLKEFVYIDGEMSFTFIEDAELDVHGTNFDLTMPGIKWAFDAGVTLYADYANNPCEDDINDCRIILNEGNTNIYQQAFAVGPIPVVININAEVYIGAYPSIEGAMQTEIRVFLAEDVTLLHSVDLPLDDPVKALNDIEEMVNGGQLLEELLTRIRFGISGEIDATAQLDLCVGIVFAFDVNGLGSSVDIPVCLSAVLEASASASMSASSGGVSAGASMSVDASLVVQELAFPFELQVPSASSAIDTACGFVQVPLEHLSPVTDCSPVLTCFTDFIDDTCEDVSDLVSALDISVELGTLTVFGEQELWSGSLFLSTVGSGDAAGNGNGNGVAGTWEDGFCTVDGMDQNSGVLKLNELNGNTDEAKAACLELCMEQPGATGCEVIWNQGNRGCYAHTQRITEANGRARHSCMMFNSGGNTATTSGGSSSTWADSATLYQNTKVLDVTLGQEYEMSLLVNPHGTLSGWSNVVHITAHGGNNGVAGDRAPAIFFHSGTTRIHVCTSCDGITNVCLDPEQELEIGEQSLVTVRVSDEWFTVFIDGVLVGLRGCTVPYNPPSGTTGEVYLSNPWYQAADADVAEFEYKIL